MSNIVQFVPKAHRDAQENLDGFIDICRNQLKVFGTSLDFDANSWDLAGHIHYKGRHDFKYVHFTTWGSEKAKNPVYMAEPFLSFAKAYLRYQHAMRPAVAISYRLRALRALEGALKAEGAGSNPTRVTTQTLNRAAQMLREKLSGHTAYKGGSDLASISDFLTVHQLVSVPTVSWRNPILRPSSVSKVGEHFDEDRARKLPSPTALEAVAKVFRVATDTSDVLVASVCAILCSAPDRINEVVLLREDCEVESLNPTNNSPIYGLRWYPAKGAAPMIKWIIPGMVDVVREAISKVRAETKQAREIARWYEANPEKVYLPPELEHFRTQDLLSMEEVARLVFDADIPNSNAVRMWCLENKLTLIKAGTGRQWQKLFARFSEVQSVLLGMLPARFPVADTGLGLKFSDMLFVARKNTFHAVRKSYRAVIEPITYDKISSRLGSNTNTTIFDKFGLVEADGSKIHLTTHQFRHYLNTVAQAGGLSQLDIAMWSGRKDVRQNDDYDHMSDRDVLAVVRASIGDPKRMIGPLATQHVALISRDEFARLKTPTAHTTEFGHCIHDFTMMPCQLHLDCINCDEQVCVKGDTVRELNIRRHVDETRILLEAAQLAQKEGDFGADRWVSHQTRTLARLEELCGIFDDARVPAGSVIQLSGLAPASRLQQAAERRAIAGHPSAPALPMPVSALGSFATLAAPVSLKH